MTENPQDSTGERLEISEEEQWRLINEAGLLKKISQKRPATGNDQDEDVTSHPDEIFNSMLLIIPFSFFLLMMEMYVRAARRGRKLTLTR